MPTLLDPIVIGDLELPNRILYSPLTRQRASAGRVPNDLMLEYYVQRASAGWIMTEATAVTPMGVGYSDTPGIWSPEQTAGWKKIVDAVHAAGGRIVVQLWHVGRISHPDFLDGKLPVSASDVAPRGEVHVPAGKKPYVAPRPLDLAEIPDVIGDYRKGAINAKTAGFDGVEIHGANGYLPDQFLRDGTNKRTDAYGGSIENRARFLLEAVDAAVEVWGIDRVGVHLSPRDMENHPARDSDPAAIYGYVARQLSERGVPYVVVRESLEGGPRFGPGIRKQFTGVYIANEAFTPETAEQVVESGEADAVSFGKLFLANPDLPKRIARGGPYNVPDPSTFYGGGAEGYTDYPTLDEAAVPA